MEGKIAAEAMIEEGFERQPLCTEQEEQNLLREKVAEYNQVLLKHDACFTVEELEEAMQKVMDTYAGGISCHYQYNEAQLTMADKDRSIRICWIR